MGCVGCISRMVHLVCNRCRKEFDKKQNYDVHINRKFPCKIKAEEEIAYELMNDPKYMAKKIVTYEQEIQQLKTHIEEIKATKLQEITPIRIKNATPIETRHIGSYVYLLHEREFINSGESVIKYGRTQAGDPVERFQKYPKGSKIVLLLGVEDCNVFEKRIRKAFMEKFEHAKEYGLEYFRGDVQEMIKSVMSLYWGETTYPLPNL
jgi:hypothetical protein